MFRKIKFSIRRFPANRSNATRLPRCRYPFALMCIVCGAAQEHRPAMIHGVNVINPQQLSLAAQLQVVEDLRFSRVAFIRAPLKPPYDKSIEFVRNAAANRLRILLVVAPIDPEAVPRGSHKRDGKGLTWPDYPLSSVSASRFRSDMQRYFDILDANAIKLAGIELGNEINWTPFNGDFPIPGNGRALGEEDLLHEPEGQAIARSYDRYIELLRTLKEIRDRSASNRQTPLISAGLADPGRVGTRLPKRMDGVTIAATLRYLRSRGLDDLVDGYGVHTYFMRNATPAQMRERLAGDVFAECGRPPDGKPCWLTEWGFRSRAPACASDPERATLFRSMLSVLDSFASSGKLRAEFYYQWDRDAFGVFRCGRLTDEARELRLDR